MDIFRVFKDVDGDISNPQKINHTHEIGDIISRYSVENQYKCVEIVKDEGVATYIFKQGIRSYTFDW